MTVREQVAAAFQAHRLTLTGYLTRMLVREDVAEDLAQQALVRALEQSSLPEEPDGAAPCVVRPRGR
jgi:DNA-directed RNA polymerase specialized sigma24 family protein